MINFELNGKEYKMPEGWEDVTLQQAVDAMKVGETIPEKLFDYTFGKEVTITDKDTIAFAEFYKRWVGYWTGIPSDVIGQMALQSTDDNLGLLDMYRMYLSKFLGAPTEYTPIDRFTLNGVTYGLPITTGDMRAKPMADGSFDEFIDSIMVKTALEESKSYDYSRLPRLTAMLFRPVRKEVTPATWRKLHRTPSKTTEYIEPYDESTILDREMEFEDLTMDKAWAAYFFLQMWSNTWQRLLDKQYSSRAKEKKQTA